MPDLFPTTQSTWLADRAAHAPAEARDHVMSHYAEPLCAYARASSLRAFGEPRDLVHEFFASRLADPAYLARWAASGLPLRRWLANGLITHTRNKAQTESRRDSRREATDPARIPEHVETHALLALERAWAMRVMLEAHDRVHAEFHADGRGAWWDLFRLHSVQGLGYARACEVTGIALGNASNANRTVATRLREVLRAILERDGVPPDDIDRELGAMQDLLEGA